MPSVEPDSHPCSTVTSVSILTLSPRGVSVRCGQVGSWDSYFHWVVTKPNTPSISGDHGELVLPAPPSSNEVLLPLPSGWCQKRPSGETGLSPPSSGHRVAPTCLVSAESKGKQQQGPPILPSTRKVPAEAEWRTGSLAPPSSAPAVTRSLPLSPPVPWCQQKPTGEPGILIPPDSNRVGPTFCQRNIKGR